MNYTSFSLNGAWFMDYTADKYLGTENPWAGKENLVRNAVPGYWEDMTDVFPKTDFYHKLRINPEYGIQQYPMTALPPDMALPTIIGNFFYKRTFNCENINGSCTLHFVGVQNAVSVWLNDVYLGRHEGYSAPFDFDIPMGLIKNGENTIVLSVSNHRLAGFNGQPVSGLTSRAANEGTGGITGDVELRVYNCPLREVSVVISEDCGTAEVSVESVSSVDLNWHVLDGENVVKEGKSDGNFAFDTDGLAFWSPDSPKLYTLVVECEGGSIERKFGVRRLLADGVHLKYNGKPYYLRGICEHCYFPITVHPNHDLNFYRDVIKKLKLLGFNFIRCHTFVPDEEYLQAADELGILFEIESPNNTSFDEWKYIVDLGRKHTSVVMYSCGNEVYIHDEYLEHMRKIANDIHARTDSLFSPMSALRGFEYAFRPEDDKDMLYEPFKHNPRRFKIANEFVDVYNSYTLNRNSYASLNCNPEEVDSWSDVYGKPRLAHEISISGTFTDLSIKDRYKGTRIGKTEMFSSLERHLSQEGVIDRVPLYFKNSSEWQRRVRKYCFETTRTSKKLAGYDFLGPIDTHWHTFGYDVGMMNEFYELKPGETVRNVLMYNSPSILVTDLGLNVNFECGSRVDFTVSCAHYEDDDLRNAVLSVKLLEDGRVVDRKTFNIEKVICGEVQKLADCYFDLPESDKPHAYKIYATLDGGSTFVENEWEVYSFPRTEKPELNDNIVMINGDTGLEEIKTYLKAGKDVVLIGEKTPFVANVTQFQIALAGRTSGNLATVINEHPITRDLPHEGFCSWQFRQMIEQGSAICFANNQMDFDPIIEIVAAHKCFVKQAAMFEFKTLGGRMFISSFVFKDTDPCANWIKNRILEYVNSAEFDPKIEYSEAEFDSFVYGEIARAEANTNFAINPNDKTSVTIKK